MTRRFRAGALIGTLLLSGGMLTACGSSNDKAPAASKDSSKSSTPTVSDSPSASDSPSTAGFDLVPLTADGYSISLPSKATKRVQDVPTALGKTHVVLYTASELSGNLFVVGLTAFPRGDVAIKSGLDGAIPGAAKTISGTVSDLKKTTFEGHEAREGRYTGTSGTIDVTVFALVASVDNKLFQIQYIVQGKDVTEPPAEYARVLSSVKFG
jgi:hypothetical protein